MYCIVSCWSVRPAELNTGKEGDRVEMFFSVYFGMLTTQRSCSRSRGRSRGQGRWVAG